MAPTDGIGASADLISKLLLSKSSRSDIISSGAWLEELDYVNDQLYAPNGSNGCMLSGELVLVQGCTCLHSQFGRYTNNVLKSHV